MNKIKLEELKEYILKVINDGHIKFYIEFNNIIENIYQENGIQLTLPINHEKIIDIFNFSYDDTLLDKNNIIYAKRNRNKYQVNDYLNHQMKKIIINYGILQQIINDIDYQIINDDRFINFNPNYYPLINMSTLMLIPISSFKKEFLSFINQNEKTNNYINNQILDDWIEILANKALIPNKRIIEIYPILSYMISYIDNQEFKNNNYDITQKSEDAKKYAKLFK